MSAGQSGNLQQLQLDLDDLQRKLQFAEEQSKHLEEQKQKLVKIKIFSEIKNLNILFKIVGIRHCKPDEHLERFVRTVDKAEL